MESQRRIMCRTVNLKAKRMKLFVKILFFIFAMIIIIVGEAKSSIVVTILQGETSSSFIQKPQFGVIFFENHNTNFCVNGENVVTLRSA